MKRRNRVRKLSRGELPLSPVTLRDLETENHPPFVHSAFAGCSQICGVDLGLPVRAEDDPAGVRAVQNAVFLAALNAGDDLADQRRAAAAALIQAAEAGGWGDELTVDESLLYGGENGTED